MAHSILDTVRDTTAWVAEQASHVRIDHAAVQAAARGASASELASLEHPVWDTDVHFRGDDAATAQYLLALDALNFCFWPVQGLEYEHLARGLKASLLEDARALDAQRLATADGPGVRALVRRPEALPLQDERARLLREVGIGLLNHYEGQALNLIHAARGSAARLVELVTAAFPGFRDHAIYRGRQVFLLKRAQIFAADVWGAFGGCGPGAFVDLHALTTFADYRVPVVLRQMGVLAYSAELAAQVDGRQLIPAGSEHEVEIRACTIQAVEALRVALDSQMAQTPLAASQGSRVSLLKNAASAHDGNARTTAATDHVQASGDIPLTAEAPDAAVGGSNGGGMSSVAVDWWLWGRGEAARDVAPSHHRVLTIYY